LNANDHQNNEQCEHQPSTPPHHLITMVTPVDFHTPDNMLSHWARDAEGEPILRSENTPRLRNDAKAPLPETRKEPKKSPAFAGLGDDIQR